MLNLYFHATPNSMKVLLALEELGLPYQLHPVDIFAGDQHSAAFRAINPNGKVPALQDGDVTVFDSHAILLHLAERHPLLPAEPQARAAALSWAMLVATGLSPYSGQAIHFRHYAPSTPYAEARYVAEIRRTYQVIDDRLAQTLWLAGEDYSLADMALWGWAASAGYALENGLDDFPHVAAFMARMDTRPAVQRALAVKAAHSFKAEMDAEARRHLFPALTA